MFGKGGGALGMWIKEFCEIVFIQTLQAFIYALAIGLIMRMNVVAMSGEDAASALGFMCVICLASIFKIEEILRRILGFGPTKADHGNAIKSIAKTGVALKLGKRVLDNNSKIVGGTKKMLGANKKAYDQLKEFNRKKRALDATANKKETVDDTSSTTQRLGSASTSTQRKIDPQKRDEKIRLFNDAQKARKMASEETDPAKKKALMNEAKEKLAQSRAIDDTLHVTTSSSIARNNMATNRESNSSSINSSVNGMSITSEYSSPAVTSRSGGYSSSTSNSEALKDQYQALADQYKNNLKEIKKEKRQGFRTMTKGIAETAGAVIGATAGGILGFADGNIEDGLNGMVSGAGVGDYVGEKVVSAGFGAQDVVTSGASAVSRAVQDYSRNISEQYQAEKEKAMESINDINKGASEHINRINRDAEKANSDLNREVSEALGATDRSIRSSIKTKTSSVGQSARRNIPAAVKAVGKGSVKAYNSRHGGIRQLNNGIRELESHIREADKNMDNNIGNSVESID